MTFKTLSAGIAVAALTVTGPALADSFVVDLTHPIPTFQPMEGDPMKPDLTKPYLDSKPIPTFGQQTVFSLGKFPTNQGHFDLGTLVLSEHHGTHMDTSGHYVNNETSQSADNPTADKRKLAHMVDGDDLTGRIVLVDISARVQAELDKNGGRPSPDKGVTDFSDASGNVVTAADIEAAADKIDNGVWIVLNQGWSRFFFDGPDFAADPYINGWNYPGLTPAAVDKIIEIENAKGVRINGIMSDVIGVETGQNSRGEDENWTNSWYAHVNGLQRGWKLVENGSNIGQLAMAKPDSCTLVVGAPKHVRGTGGPSRVLAICEK
ncbi:MAG: cyclase family protein [Hyphomicrobiales bacterium]|nr:cyclase family protein [Hyphomicrobiales bacterium]